MSAEMSVQGPDSRFPITFFDSFGASKKTQGEWSLEALARKVATVSAKDKNDLPWLKLAVFGDIRTDKNSLRHDGNVLSVTGIEADYDGGLVTVDEAIEVATKQGILALIYTSPSHSEDNQRWRILCPLSEPIKAADRGKMMGRLNGLYRGIFAGESWTVSQSYYFGSVNRNPSHRVAVVDGTPIDLHDDLDEIWMAKPATEPKGSGTKQFTSGPANEAALLDQIVSGESYHAAYVRLLGKWALAGVPLMDARRKLVAVMENVPEAERDARWRFRFDDIDRCLSDIYGKEARAKDEGRRSTRLVPVTTAPSNPAESSGDWGEIFNEPAPTAPLGWQSQLTRGEKGAHATVRNAVLVLGCDPAVVGIVARDDFAHRIIVTRPPPPAYVGAAAAPGPYPRSITDTDVTLLQGYIQGCYDMRISQPVAQQAVVAAADNFRVHPVRRWLDGLKWDGIPRVGDWLHFAFGAKQDLYHQAVGTKVLCAAVRRVRRPGCKFDHVMVLEGLQGKGKSRSCAALVGQEWFTDNLPHDLASKDAQQGMSGKWVIELAELNVLVRTTSQTAKGFFSREVDYFRPPYGKAFEERPRQCIFIGTTNDADYLTDPTGNRRYWPVYCEFARAEWIAEFREQLWAEAYILEAADENLWLDEGELQNKAAVKQSSRVAEDVWTPAVRNYVDALEQGLGPRTVVRVPHILNDALGLPRAQQNRSAEMRVAAILRADGWARHKHRGSDGRPIVSWFAPGQQLPGRGTHVPTVDTSEEDFA